MTKTADSKGNMKKLWRTLSGIMGREDDQNRRQQPPANDFANFADKVEAVRLSTSTDSFSTLTSEQVEKTVSAAQGKTCHLVPSPTWIVKEFRTRLSPFIARFFNESLATGCFSQKFNHAIITPLLKQHGRESA